MAKRRKHDSILDVWIGRYVSKKRDEGFNQQESIRIAQAALARYRNIHYSESTIRRRFLRFEERRQIDLPWVLPILRPLRGEGRPKGSLYPDIVRNLEIYESVREERKQGHSWREAYRIVGERMGLPDGTIKSVFKTVRTHPRWANVVALDPPL